MNRGMACSLLGWCPACGASYASPYVVDRLCAPCQRHEDRVYRNRPEPAVELEPRAFSTAAMRERLSVSGDVDE